jgi:cytochrome P450
MLGLDPSRAADFKRWTTDLIGGLTVTSEEQAARFRRSLAEFKAYFVEVFEERRRAPGDDILSDLLRGVPGEEPMTDHELLCFIDLLLVAGNETTTNLIGNTMVALLERPELLDAVRADRSLIPALIEESVRHNSPTFGMFRRPVSDVELGGAVIPRDSVVLVLTASANHDEGKFPDPARFDIQRDTRGHLGFGYGAHYCLGAPLARMEGAIALEVLLSRLARVERKAPEVQWIDSLFLRGPASLPLHISGH